MKIRQIMALTGATVVCGNGREDHEVQCAFASDLMSDTLAYADHCTVLLTGLCNTQVLRTAEMLELAREDHVCILQTGYSMYAACGILYNAGLEGGFLHER